MKIKLTTLLFGLLLAVGWTSSAFAQNSPNNIPDAVYSAQSLANKTYTWTDAQGNDQTANYVKLNPKTQKYEGAWVKDPYQIYDLLRNIYMDPAFPGPKYSAWDASNKNQTTNSSLIPGNREDPVYYGGIGGGWNIGVTSSSTGTLGNITIDGGTNSDYVQNAKFNSIRVLDMETGNVITEWNNSQSSFPTGWTAYNVRQSNSSGFYYFRNTSSYIRINSSLLNGHTRVKVEVKAYDSSTYYYGYIRINGYSNTVSAESATELETIDLVYSAISETLAADGTYTPTDEGYTALVVTVKNGLGEFPSPEPSSYLGSCSFETKKEIIDFITLTIDSVKLLTDGLRIGDADKYTTGTVFNCDGTYNKFFFLSKGQARKKSAYVKNQISSNAWPSYAGEELPFKEMFEQFSPTTGGQGDEITDFYSEMMEGHVYNVVHDCASVIQNAHQFSMSGNSGTTAYGMTGLNFFIPDYRLMLWWNPQTYDNQTYTRVDGRDFVPYQYYHTTYGWTNFSSTGGVWSANYAQYNQLYAPKIGIYRITLEADAHQCTGYNEETNPYYEVTLNWTSSLNEMSGKDVPQTYEIYEVVYDPETNTEKNVLRATVNNVTTYTFPCPPNYLQEDHSVTHTYIIKGWPTANTHPSFIAWSNQDDVVIPGLKDFLALDLDHYESDFIIADQMNWYRNFLMVKNENDLKALTTVNVNTDGMNKFTLYRFLYDNEGHELAPGVKIADLTFDPIAENATRAHYKVTYDKDGYWQQKIEPYDINIAALYKEENGQQVEVHPAYNIPDAYQRATMGIPDEGDLSIKGSGDVIIWPSGLEVNFLSIKVTVNNTTTTWTPTTNGDNLPTGWALSPGCKWVEHNGAYYLEGMGYIMIPAAGDGNATVTIKAYGDGSSTARITVNDVQKPFLNGKDKAEEKTWIVAAANRAPMHADRADTEVTFTPAGFNYDTQREQTIGSVTLYTSSGDFNYSDYIRINGTTTISTTEGKITKIVFNGQSTSSPVSNLSTQTGTYTTSNNVGTWTGEATEVSFTGSTYCTSIVVTVTTGGGDEPPTPANTRMIRLAIPIVDQLNASTANNTHPRRYGYVLRYEPAEGEKKESGRVTVPVQHTDSKVNGYYTLDELDNDTEIGVNHDEGIKLNVMTADVEMTLSATNTSVFYNTIQGKANDLPKEYKNYETVLQRQTDGSFKEMKNPSDLFGYTYQPGEYHYWDSIPTKVTYDPAKYFGTYDGGEFKSYVPSVTTMGHNRRYYEIDSLHNTYGAPIWKTGVGKVVVNSVEAQRQTNKNNSVNWTYDGEKCSLYMLNNIDADGYLPKKKVSNVDYEPYMFRVFVESKNGKLRKYHKVDADPTNTTAPGEHLEGEATPNDYAHGPICVWSAYVNLNNDAELEALNEAYDNVFSDPAEGVTYDIKFHKDTVARAGGNDANPLGVWDKDANNAKFGAVDELETENGKIKADELTVFVRFYYIAKGMCPATHKPWMPTRDGEDDPGSGYGAESPGTSPSPATAVNEISYYGEIVSQTYFNVQGMQSDQPFDGVNIVVTRFSNGTTSVSKVVR